MALPVGAILETQCIGVGVKNESMIVRHWRVKNQAPDDVFYINEVINGFLFRLRGMQSQFFTWNTIKWRRADEPFVTPYVTHVWSGLSGDKAVGYGPQQIAGLLSYQVEENMSDARGRIYVPGMPYDMYINGGWTPPWPVFGNVAAQNILASFRGGGSSQWLELGVYSTLSPHVFFAMTNCVFRPEPAIIRSRRAWI